MPTYTYGTSVAELGAPTDASAIPLAYAISSTQSPPTIVGSGGIMTDADTATYVSCSWSGTRDSFGNVSDAWYQPAIAQILPPSDLPVDAVIYSCSIGANATTMVGASTGLFADVIIHLFDGSTDLLYGGITDFVGGDNYPFDFTAPFFAGTTTADVLAGDLSVVFFGDAGTSVHLDPTWQYPNFGTVRIYEVTVTFLWYVVSTARRPHCRIHPRDDNRGPSRRIFPPPTSAQTPGRITGYQ